MNKQPQSHLTKSVDSCTTTAANAFLKAKSLRSVSDTANLKFHNLTPVIYVPRKFPLWSYEEEEEDADDSDDASAFNFGSSGKGLGRVRNALNAGLSALMNDN